MTPCLHIITHMDMAYYYSMDLDMTPCLHICHFKFTPLDLDMAPCLHVITHMDMDMTPCLHIYHFKFIIPH